MSSPSAIVNCSAYRQGRKLRDLSAEEISDVLGDRETFVWVGLHDPEQAQLRQMQEEFHLHELAIEDASNAHQRPKLEEYGDSLFLVLHTAHLENGRIEVGETHIFVGQQFVVTVRHGPSSSYSGVRERVEAMPERLARGPGFVLYAIADFIVDQYRPCMDDLRARFTRLERQLFVPRQTDDGLESFYLLKNELLKLQAAATPMIDICNQLLRFHGYLIPRETRVYYRDILDHVERITQDADRMREMINAAMQVALAQITIRQNEVVKRLAGWAGILAVPTMVFSLYGMNFKFMPELEWQWSYPLLMSGLAGACVLLHRRLKRIGWL
ncbi:magnesium/cobalt transporter CorA [Noviherbaspirillum aridicola]|uniref:Magnesium transport protein CorA n=1 Tax=Noviherbaspirillum aridicola TaxID=2849687 RepID=A0ABQ4PZB8_9BURK|nr:magnesium/cobalt transporter CorA [Noviherbaspirillum aridicola]GIZ50147.1 magnesium transporter CorA [Noviherbaspirillum aridicola]